MVPSSPQISQTAAMRRDDICIHVSPRRIDRAVLKHLDVHLVHRFDNYGGARGKFQKINQVEPSNSRVPARAREMTAQRRQEPKRSCVESGALFDPMAKCCSANAEALNFWHHCNTRIGNAPASRHLQRSGTALSWSAGPPTPVLFRANENVSGLACRPH